MHLAPHRGLGLVLLAGLLGSPATSGLASGSQDDATGASALWHTAGDRSLAVDDRVAALRALCELGPDVAADVADRAGRECERYAKGREKDAARLVRDFAKAAPRVVTARLGKKEQLAVEADRGAVLDLARGEGLTKEAIVATSDPARERLHALLVVDVGAVLDAEPDLRARLEAWDQAAFEEALFRDAFDDALVAMRKDEAGARRAGRLERPADPVPAGKALEEELAWQARLATPMPKADRRVLEANRPELAALDAEEAAGIRATNDLRVLLGLGALRFDEKLGRAARGHSQDMVERGFFAHESPVEGKETPWKRAALEGTSASAENIAAGQASGPDAVQAWWHSPGHHKNLLGGHARIGLGRYQDHWTQMFGR